MKFYAYLPDKDGKEPMGTANRVLFKLKTYTGAIHKALRLIGKNAKLFRYINFYDKTTFIQIQ